MTPTGKGAAAAELDAGTCQIETCTCERFVSIGLGSAECRCGHSLYEHDEQEEEQ